MSVFGGKAGDTGLAERIAWLRGKPWLCLTLLFVIARLAALAAGNRFQVDNLTSWMQIADVALLREDLWGTLYYLHSQPPLYNLLIGLLLPLGDQAFAWAMWVIYAAVALGGILSFHAVARDISGMPRLAFAISVWFCVAPSVLLFSQKLYYDGLVPWMLCMAVWGLHSGLKRRNFGRMLFGFSMLAATILLRAMFHPLLFVCAVAVLALLARGQARRVLAAAIGPFLAIALVIARNMLLFGVSQLSSWAPLSPGQTTFDRIPQPVRLELMAQGKLSRFAPIQVFSPPTSYLALMDPPPEKTGVPSLDNLHKSTGEPNWNHIVYTKIGPERTRDALFALGYDPATFARIVATALYHFHRPASEFKGLEANLADIRGWDRLANATFGLQPAAWFGSSLDPDRPRAYWMQISYTTLLASIAFGGCVVLSLAALVSAMRRRRWPEERLAIPLILTGFGSFIIALSSSFDVWENNRAHYDIAPILMLGALWFTGWLAAPRRAPDRP